MFWFWTISFYPFLLLHLAPLCSGGKGGAPTLLLQDFPSSLNLPPSLLEVQHLEYVA